MAEPNYANDCNGDVLFECNRLAAKYREPSYYPPVFPDDPVRADALVRTAIDGALTGCAEANYDLCFTLSDLLLRFTSPPADPRYSDEGRMQAYLTSTESGCESGIPAACYWRSVAFNRHLPEAYEIGLSLEQAKGMTRAEAEASLASTKAAFQNRALAAATAQVASLRQTCASNAPTDCRALAVLLSEYADLRRTPNEHVSLLLDACTTSDRTTCTKLSSALFALGMAPVSPQNISLKAASLQSLNRTCAAGNAAHCLILSNEGRKDPTLDALQFLTKACTAGAKDACLSLATRHLFTYGDTKNTDDLLPATNLLERACDLKSNTACHILEHLTKG